MSPWSEGELIAACCLSTCSSSAWHSEQQELSLEKTTGPISRSACFLEYFLSWRCSARQMKWQSLWGPASVLYFSCFPQIPNPFNPADENIAAYPSLPPLLGGVGNPWTDVQNKETISSQFSVHTEKDTQNNKNNCIYFRHGSWLTELAGNTNNAENQPSCALYLPFSLQPNMLNVHAQK